MKKYLLVVTLVFTAFVFGNTAQAADNSLNAKQKIEINSLEKIQEPITLPSYCTAGTITQHTCPDGFQVNSGLIIVTFNCETGNIVSIYAENWANNPQICQGHGGGIIAI